MRLTTGLAVVTTACRVDPGCEFVENHAGSHGAVLRPSGTYCAPLRCYCGECPPPPVVEVEALTEEQARAFARATVARRLARQAAVAAARQAIEDARPEELTARQEMAQRRGAMSTDSVDNARARKAS